MDDAARLDSAPTSRGLLAGERAFGRFVLVRQLGRGGMGVVWLARDEALECEVALKFLPDTVRWDPAALAALRRETRRSRELTHPHIVRVHDIHEDTGAAAIAMEYLPGGSLHQLRATRSPPVLECDEIAAWLPGLCAALDHAHAQGVVHRDLKPANLLVAADGAVKISDFGIAQPLFETALRLSQWAPSGTLAYMSPQQQFGEPASASDDLYALGAALYELLTGKPPFYSGNLAAQIERRRPDSVAERRRQLGVAGGPIPAPWEETIAACLAKRAEDRPGTAAAIAAHIAFVSDHPARLPSRRPARPWLLGGLALVMGSAAWQSTRPAPVAPAVAAPAFASDATRAWGAWNFDGDGRDVSGRGLDMIVDRAVPTEDRFGRIDRAWQLNGNTAIRREGLTAADWRADQPFSVALWVKRQPGATDMGEHLVTLRSERQDDFYWDLSLASGRPSFLIARLQVDNPDAAAAGDTLPANRWCHVVATSDGDTLRLFIDGREAAQAAITHNRGATMSAPPTLLVGYQHKFDLMRFAGAVDELRLWRRALTAAEVARLARPEAPPRFLQTAGTYPGTEDLAQAVSREYGPGGRLADWQSLRRWQADDTVAFCEEIGVTINNGNPLVQNQGRRHFETNRQYFLTRFDGRKPGYFLAHEELGGMTLALGSWHGLNNRLLAELPPVTPSRRMLTGQGSVTVDFPAEPRPVAALALHWRQTFAADSTAGLRAEIVLRDGRRLTAACNPMDTGRLALALGESENPRHSRQIPASYGRMLVSLVVRDGRLAFRAVSPVGLVPIFQEELAVDFSAARVATVSLSGVDSAELTVER